jgi:hypothetical protein
MEQRAGKFNCGLADLATWHPLILRSGPLGPRLEGWAASRRMGGTGASWFETREDALLTMRR